MAEYNTQFGNKAYEDLHENQQDFLRKVIGTQNMNYYLKGCAGSGKTLIGSIALDIISKQTNDKTAMLLVYTQMLKNFIKDNLDNPTLDINHYHMWSQSPTYRNTILVDECQDFEEEWIEEVKGYSDFQIWLGDINQQIYSDAEEDGGFENLIYNSEDVENHEFVVNYRNSISTANFAKLFMQLTEYDIEAEITLKEKQKSFIKPILNNPKQTSGARNQPVVLIDCENQQAEFDCMAAIIKLIRESNEDSKQIVIAQLHHKALDLIEKELTNRNISYKRLPKFKKHEVLSSINFRKDKDLILLSTIHSLKGVEMDYVIFPRTEDYNIKFFSDDEINLNLLFTLFTRPKTRVFCTFTDKYSSVVYNQIDNVIDELDDLEKEFFTLVKSKEYLGTETKQLGGETEPTEAVTEKSSGDIDDLIKKYFVKQVGKEGIKKLIEEDMIKSAESSIEEDMIKSAENAIEDDIVKSAEDIDDGSGKDENDDVDDDDLDYL